MSERSNDLVEALRLEIKALAQGCASQARLNRVLRRQLYEQTAWITRLLRELKLVHEELRHAKRELLIAQELLPELRLQAYRAKKLEQAVAAAHQDLKNKLSSLERKPRVESSEHPVRRLEHNLAVAQKSFADLTQHIDSARSAQKDFSTEEWLRETTEAFASSVASTEQWGVWEQGRIELELQRILSKEEAITVTLSDAHGLPMAVVGDMSVGDGLSAVAGAAATLSRTAHDLLPIHEVARFSMEDQFGVSVSYTSIDVEGVRLLLGIWRSRDERRRAVTHSDAVLRAADASDQYPDEEVGS